MYVETSAATGQNVDKAFTILINGNKINYHRGVSVSKTTNISFISGIIGH
jgi:uncharacterized protein (UPF0248 family)